MNTDSLPEISRGHGEMLLVVDDEQQILMAMKEVLTCQGWKVQGACDGKEALALFLNYANEIKAVVTDLCMPNLDGIHLIRALRELAPDLPILVSSAFYDESSQNALCALQVHRCLQKPFTARTLSAEVAALFHPHAG
ncbi:MAG: response regulator [Verrucomicrobia bacterium]|nr:response regulator [Verrucomicrobiota bacterium]